MRAIFKPSHRSLFGSLWRDQRGATAVEYGIIAALFILALIKPLEDLAIAMYGNRSVTHCTERLFAHAGNERRTSRIIRRGACRNFNDNPNDDRPPVRLRK